MKQKCVSRNTFLREFNFADLVIFFFFFLHLII